MNILAAANLSIVFLIGVRGELQVNTNLQPGIYYSTPELIISVFMLAICVYALYKLFTQSKITSDYKIMHCPECGEEPYKIWKWSGPGVSFYKRLKGYLTCINCGTYLRRIHGRLLYVCIFFMTLSYLVVISMPLYLSFESHIDLIIPIITVFGGLLVISALTSLFLLVARTRFVKVKE